MTEEVKDTQASRRLEAMESIARRNDRRQEREEEKEEEKAAPKVEEKAEAAQAPEPAPEVMPEPEPEPEPAPVIQKHKLKVNGKEIELTTDELIARAQKVEAADQYLQEASQVFKATRQPEPKAGEVKPSTEEDDAALARAIQTGSEEEARRAIANLRAHSSQAATPDDVLRMVDQRLAFQEAARRFQTEYKDVFEDPYLLQLAMVEDDKLTKKGDTRGYWERYQEIGDGLRKWRDTFKSQPAQSDKQQRKASVTVLPTASARAAGKTEEPEQTTQDVIREMAASRRGR